MSGSAQSRDENNPTPITAFPVTGTLGSGTYYYEIPESLVGIGAANAVLDFTPPDGGGSMTVTFSGRRCCPSEAYIGITSGLPDRVREATTFEIPGRQPLLVTVYISVGAKQTVSFRLNFNMGVTGSGIIVTPPPATPTPTTPSGPVCTDLGVIGFMVSPVTSVRNKISGEVFNITTTHPYKGYARRQWVEVRDITDSETRPRIVARIFLPEIIESGRRVPFATLHDLSARRRRPRYEIRLNYSHLNASDESQYNDDCNTRNNISRRVLIGPFSPDDTTRPEVLVPVTKP